ncbi:hypothetical protein ACP70R_043118 [Stipagrostis hirtigluma subsp. patula]
MERERVVAMLHPSKAQFSSFLFTTPALFLYGTMANFSIDPTPYVPQGFSLVQRDPLKPPSRTRCFIAKNLEKRNEDVAIAVLVPEVAKEDFSIMATELRKFLFEEEKVSVSDIQPCPIGAAFVKFGCFMKRQSAINNSPHRFGPYCLSFIPHDEGINARSLPLNRVIWIMMLCFPLDAVNVHSIGQAVSSFGILLNCDHDSCQLGRVVAQILVNESCEIPDEVTITVQNSTPANSWSVPIEVLHIENVIPAFPEDKLPIHGPLHPYRKQVTRWIGSCGNGTDETDALAENSSLHIAGSPGRECTDKNLDEHTAGPSHGVTEPGKNHDIGSSEKPIENVSLDESKIAKGLNLNLEPDPMQNDGNHCEDELSQWLSQGKTEVNNDLMMHNSEEGITYISDDEIIEISQYEMYSQTKRQASVSLQEIEDEINLAEKRLNVGENSCKDVEDNEDLDIVEPNTDFHESDE